MPNSSIPFGAAGLSLDPLTGRIVSPGNVAAGFDPSAAMARFGQERFASRMAAEVQQQARATTAQAASVRQGIEDARELMRGGMSYEDATAQATTAPGRSLDLSLLRSAMVPPTAPAPVEPVSALAAPSPALKTGDTPTGAVPPPASPPPQPATPPTPSTLARVRLSMPDLIPSMADTVAAAESSGRDDARNPGSSASGRYQITNGLWNDYAPRLGLTASQRNDPAAQRRIFETYAGDVTPELATILGRSPRADEVYGSWLLGRGGANAIYGANPGADAFETYAAVAGRDIAEQAFSRNGGLLRPGMTVGQVRQGIADFYGRGMTPGGGRAASAETAVDAASSEQTNRAGPASLSAVSSAPHTSVSPVDAMDLLRVPPEPAYVRDQSTHWLALGAGLLSSADPREAMSAGAAGLAKAQGQANKDEQAARQAAQDRAIRLAQVRATLGSADIARHIQMDQFGQTLAANQQNRADTLTLHRDQMAMQEQLRRDQLAANQQRWDADRAARADLIQQRAEAAAQAAKDKEEAAQAAARDRKTVSITKDELPMVEKLAEARSTLQRGQVILNQLDNGELDLGLVTNLGSRARNYAGFSSTNSQNYAELERYVTGAVNTILNQAKGPQTDQDAIRARDNILSNLNDKEVVRQGLTQLLRLQANLHDDTVNQIQGRRRALNLDPAYLSPYAAPALALGGDDGIRNIRRIR